MMPWKWSRVAEGSGSTESVQASAPNDSPRSKRRSGASLVDASLRAPGRNGWRSGGHGKRRAERCRAIKVTRLESRLSIPRVNGSSRDGRSVERCRSGNRSPTQRQLKGKISLAATKPRPPSVRGHGRPVTSMAEPCTLLEGP